MISAVVPTYHGAERLARNLPSVVASLEATREPWEIVVVDDGGGEISGLPPGARLLRLETNQGYGPAVDAGARETLAEHLLVLNDDVRLEADCVTRLWRRFPDPALFAVVPAIRSRLAACGDEGGKAARHRAGLVEIEEAPATEPHTTFYPVGCCYLCRRDVFLELGGYDDLYAPFFWEDVDLGYRAWSRGLATLHLPQAVCYHEGSATIGEQPMSVRQTVWYRNWALFHLRNLRNPRLRAASLGAWAAYALFDDRASVREGLAAALDRLERVGPRTGGGLPDEDVLRRVGQP